MRKFKYESFHTPDFSSLNTSIIMGGVSEGYLVDTVDGLGSPEFIPQTQSAPFQNGASYIDGLHSSRVITITGYIMTGDGDLAEINTAKRTLSRALNPAGMGYNSSDGETYLGKLSYSPDGVTYSYFIDCVPMSAPIFPEKPFQQKQQPFTVSFYCPGPYWYGAEVTVTGGAFPTDGTNNYAPNYAPVWCQELLKWVGCGDGGGMTVSTDGIVWDWNLGPDGYIQRAVCWNPDGAYFCSVGDNGSTWKSADGVTWTQSIITGNPPLIDVCYSHSNLLFVAISQETNSKIYNSSDAVTWSLVDTAASTSHTSVAWSEGVNVFVVVAQSGASLVKTSIFGSTWVDRTAASAIAWQGVCWSESLNLFCAVANSGTNRVMTSPTGTTWTIRTASSLNSWINVAYSNKIGMFIAVDGSLPGKLMTSVNGTTWVDLPLQSGTTTVYKDVGINDREGYILLTPLYSAYTCGLSFDGLYLNNADDAPSAMVNWAITVTNNGDVPVGFEVVGRLDQTESAKLVILSNGFAWTGLGDVRNQNYIGISSTNFKLGDIVINTNYGLNEVSQFNLNRLSSVQYGNFFKITPGVNYVFYRSTMTSASTGYMTPPTLTYRPKYVGV